MRWQYYDRGQACWTPLGEVYGWGGGGTPLHYAPWWKAPARWLRAVQRGGWRVRRQP